MRVRTGLVAGGDEEGDNKTGGSHLHVLMLLDMLLFCVFLASNNRVPIPQAPGPRCLYRQKVCAVTER